MMNPRIVCLMVILLFAASGLARSRNKQTKSLSQTSVVTNIRGVDFKNFSYPSSLFSSQCGIRKTGIVRIVKGKGPTNGKCQLSASRIGVGALTGEVNEVAMVNIRCNCGEIGVNREEIYAAIYFYRIQSGQVKLLGKEPASGQLTSDYLRYYNKSSDEDVGTFGPKIEQGLVTYKLVTRTGPVRSPDSRFGAKLQYRWNGEVFVLAGRPERWLCADFDCELQR